MGKAHCPDQLEMLAQLVEDVRHLGRVRRPASQFLWPLDLPGRRLRAVHAFGIGRAELFAELCRSEPLVIARRRLILLIVEQTPEGGLLLGTALQNQQHSFHRKAGRRRAEVEFWAR